MDLVKTARRHVRTELVENASTKIGATRSAELMIFEMDVERMATP